MVRSPNPEVLLLLVQMYPHLPVSAIFFTGKGRLKRNIAVGNTHKYFGQLWVSGLLGFNALTGSDMTGRFAD